MIKKNTHTASALALIVAGGSCLTGADELRAAEKKKSYTNPPFGMYSSQMHDALLGGDKYEKPVWNLHDTLNLPKWLDLSVEQRTRYELRDGTFKSNLSIGDQQIALQTDVWAQVHLNKFRLGLEFLDARALGADSGSGVSNSQANTADFIQGYVSWADQNVGYSGLGAEVTLGRQTMNLGSRRLVARNVFRNTTNNFTGGRIRLLDYDNWQFNGFVTMPVNRYPNTSAEILDDVHRFDEENTHTLFSGGIFEKYDIFMGVNGEAYLYHLDEGASAANPSKKRRYFTPGMRFYIKPKKGQFDFESETIGQFGTVRATTSSSQNLDHEAWYQHADIGYTFDAPMSPRLAALYDYASGDRNPNDNKEQRFDTLYGPTVSEFGPTGIYNSIARSNISSPGYRIKFSPLSDVQTQFTHRFFWLASSTDSWNGLQDKTGRSGDYVGHQLLLTTRWNVNSSLNFETGWAHFFKGEFAKNAPTHPNTMDVDYFYVQSLLRF